MLIRARAAVTPSECNAWTRRPPNVWSRARGPMVGIRSKSEILERIEAIADETRAAPLVPTDVEALSQILSVRGCAQSALDQLRAIQRKLPGIELSLDGFEDRLKALKSHGLDPSRISFEASYGRTTLEYYDGFVFGFVPESGDEASPSRLGRAIRLFDAPIVRRGFVSGSGRRRKAGGRGQPYGIDLMPLKIGIPAKGRIQSEAISWMETVGMHVVRSKNSREYSREFAGSRIWNWCFFRQATCRLNCPQAASIWASPASI